MTSRPLVVNGRFLLAQRTGLQRVTHDLLLAARRLPLDFTVVAPARPAGYSGLTVDRVVRGPGGRVGGLFWEQVVLPPATRGCTVLSPVNLAPVAAGDNVVMVHDIAPTVGPQWFSRSGRFYGRIVVAAARRARVVLTVSEQVRAELAGIGVEPSRLHVVRPAVDRPPRPVDAGTVDAVRRSFGLGRDYLLFVGWADPRKDVATAAAASARVVGALPHDLVLVGRPYPAFAPVAVPDGPNVRPLGFVSDADLAALMAGAAALVYPTRYEGFGLPPLEAWSHGTPALVSDLPVLRESTEGRAVYVPVGDVGAWAEAIRAALRGELTVPDLPRRTWGDAARDLAAALELA